MAEFDLLSAGGQAIARTGWQVTTDSQETSAENGRVTNAFDGDPATYWHSVWSVNHTGMPHSVVIDTRASQAFKGFRYMPRDGGGNGTVAQYRLFVSPDGVNWGTPVSQGNLTQLGAAANTKTVLFAP